MRHLRYIEAMMFGAMMMVQSCSSHYPDMEYPDGNGNAEHTFSTPITVSLNKQNMFSLVATRGSGSFETGNISQKCENSLFYIFAFRDGTDADLSQTVKSDTAHSNCLVDSDIPYFGKASRLEKDSTGTLYFVEDENLVNKTKMYYSQTNSSTPYHFTGYYVDDYVPTASTYHRNAEGIYYDLKIDGTQDVLCGYAPDITSSLLKSRYDNIELTATEREKILSIKGYSTYAAQYGINPVLNLKHVLTKLKFEIVPADSTADNVTIRNISIIGKNSGKMIVAARNMTDIGLSAYDNTDTLQLHEPSTDGKTTLTLVSAGNGYSVKWDDSYANKNLEDITGVNVGGCIMPVPATSYKLCVESNVINKLTGKTYLVKSSYTITPPENTISYDSTTGKYVFKAGYEYTIKLGVFGQAMIRISTTVDTWKSGDTIILDPEQHL